MKVIFNVFKDFDLDIYDQLLGIDGDIGQVLDELM